MVVNLLKNQKELKMKNKILIIMLCLFGLQGFAQQDPQYSLYMFNPMSVNPGYAGSREVLSGVLIHRSQWVGLDGAPETQVLSVNSPLKNKKMGLGLQIINDKIGAHTTQTFKATYAYRLKLGKGKLAFGLSGGIMRYNYDWAKVDYKDNDDAVPELSPESFTLPTVDFGIYYNTNTMYIGFGAEHLNQASYGFEQENNVSTGLNGGTNNNTAQQYINYTGTIGKAFVVNTNLVFKASVLFRLVEKTTSADVNAGILIKNKIYFGASVRPTAIIGLTEINLTKYLRMGIAYDFERSDVASSTSGSFEIFLGYDLKLFKSKVTSPRYF